MTVNVLWTSGWDSTFRVLDAVFNKKTDVQPYYVVDESRNSTYMEIKTMNEITSMVNSSNKEGQGKVLDLNILNKKDIPADEKITNDYKTLASQSTLGNQYDWLARFCHYNGIRDIELCIHKDDNVGKIIRKDAIYVDGYDGYYKLRKNLSQPALSLFTYFNYPLFEISKLEMEVVAKESGFDHIMEKTWFCHSPINDKPCGICNPCKYTREEGLGRRVPEPTLKNKTILFASKVKKRVLG